MKEFIPTTCSECGEILKVITGKNGKYKLICNNDKCEGKLSLRFQKGISCFNISGIGPSIANKLFKSGIKDIADLLTITPNKLIESGEFKDGRALEKLMLSIESVKNIKFHHIIESLQFEGIGSTISKVCEKIFFDLPYDLSGIDYNLREIILNKNSDVYTKTLEIINVIVTLTDVEIVYPEKEETKKHENFETKIFEMTGSPKEFGFNTKNDFIKAVEPFGLVHGKLNKDCHYLVTDDTESKTSKMAKAEKLGVKVITYSDLFNEYNN